MGSNNKTTMKKVGVVLINVKANRKSRNYVFSCEFCKESCDQLKKFTFHLDTKHSEQILEKAMGADYDYHKLQQDVDIKSDFDILETQIKVEELLEIQDPSVNVEDAASKISIVTKEETLYQDPLETDVAEAKLLNDKDVYIKSEQIEGSGDEIEGEDLNEFSLNTQDMRDNDSCDGSEFETEYKVCGTNRSRKVISSDSSSNDSKDSDFNLEEKQTRAKRVYRKRIKMLTNDDINVDPKTLTKAILEAFETQPILWKIKNRSHSKEVRQNTFEAVAQHVNKKLQIQLTWKDAQQRIKEIHEEYSRAYEKLKEGEQIEMPWYTENAKFLDESIKASLYNKRKRNRRLKTLDETRMSLLIKYYRLCEGLWQTNNIDFVLRSKKIEALEFIIKDIKEMHSIELNLYEMQRSLDYINRIYSADKSRQLKCEEEKSDFVASSRFYNDLSFLSDSQGPFRCPHCKEIIQKYESYHQHVAEHTNVDPFKCGLCEMRFSKISKYVLHAKRHLCIYDYTCKFCGKGYPVKAELDRHMREHTGEEPYLCDICGAGFKSSESYNNHKLRHENRFRYECHLCKQGFNHKPSLRDHIRVHLNVKDILCNICGKGFTTKRYLLHHQLIHSDSKRYKCGVCGKAFAQGAGMRAHQKLHKKHL